MKTGKANLNSTNNGIKEQLENIFDQRILPLHAALAENSEKYFLLSKKDNRETYFESPKNVDFAYFADMSIGNKEALEATFKSFWLNQNDTDLLGLASDFAHLAIQMRALNQEQTAEVSELIYVMF